VSIDPELLEKGVLGLLLGGLGCFSPIDPGMFFPLTTAWIVLVLDLVVWGATIIIGRNSSLPRSGRPSDDRPVRSASLHPVPPRTPSSATRDHAPISVSAKELPYRIRDDFLSPMEFSFYHVLKDTIGASLVVCPKVRLADIFFVAKPNVNRTYFSRIAQKHLDFLVCDAKTMRPVLGIELDDASHQRPDRQERDAFVDAVFRTAGLPLLRWPTQSGYNPADLARKLGMYLTGYTLTGVLLPSAVPHPVGVPQCPKCGVLMITKTATRGKYLGRQFYACPNFPQCREIQPIDPLD